MTLVACFHLLPLAREAGEDTEVVICGEQQLRPGEVLEEGVGEPQARDGEDTTQLRTMRTREHPGMELEGEEAEHPEVAVVERLEVVGAEVGLLEVAGHLAEVVGRLMIEEEETDRLPEVILAMLLLCMMNKL